MGDTKVNVTALLPMKGHSERVPNKNIRNFAGRPLFHYVAEILESSPYIKSIVINTDSEIIAEDATKHFSKVKIIQRPTKLQGDSIPMNEIIKYDLSKVDCENFLQTHSTNPLLKKATLEKAIEKYMNLNDGNDSLFSVTNIQTRLYWGNGEPVNHNPNELLRTQDLPPLFEENSNFYLFTKKSFENAGNNRIGLKPFMFEMDKLEAIDIDMEEDFKLAEIIYRKRLNLND